MKSHIEWWWELSLLQRAAIEIENGTYGHDEGTTESEIEELFLCVHYSNICSILLFLNSSTNT